jgi:hypothetical protein
MKLHFQFDMAELECFKENCTKFVKLLFENYPVEYQMLARLMTYWQTLEEEETRKTELPPIASEIIKMLRHKKDVGRVFDLLIPPYFRIYLKRDEVRNKIKEPGNAEKLEQVIPKLSQIKSKEGVITEESLLGIRQAQPQPLEPQLSKKRKSDPQQKEP